MLATFEIKENTILVLLGASGDLAKKKLVIVPIGCLLSMLKISRSFQHSLAS